MMKAGLLRGDKGGLLQLRFGFLAIAERACQ